MRWMAVLILFWGSAAAASNTLPEKPGVYLEGAEGDWIPMTSAPMDSARTRGLKTYMESGGYTRLGMDVYFEGKAAALRTTESRPRFFIRNGSAAGTILIVRLTPRGKRRRCRMTHTDATIGNRPGFRTQDIVRMTVEEGLPGGVWARAEQQLDSGEYLLVKGDVADGYDFGVD